MTNADDLTNPKVSQLVMAFVRIWESFGWWTDVVVTKGIAMSSEGKINNALIVITNGCVLAACFRRQEPRRTV